MELRHLRYFDALAETLNFTRAAERLHVTQSTLSHQIKQLEDELGTVLFDRSTKRVRMTEAGELLRSHTAPALQHIDRGIQTLRGDMESLTDVVRLGTTPSFNASLVPACLSTFLGAYPSVQLSVEELPAGAIVDGLMSDRLDLGVSYRPADISDLRFEPLYNEELRLVVAATHPLARRRRVRMVELHHMRMVLLPRQMSTRLLLDECFEAAGATPLVVAEMNSIGPMMELIRRTQLAGIIAETAVSASPELRIVPLEDPTPIRTPGLLWKKGSVKSPVMKHFSSIIRRAATAA